VEGVQGINAGCRTDARQGQKVGSQVSRVARFLEQDSRHFVRTVTSISLCPTANPPETKNFSTVP
jgi:hypothetical protein